MHAYEVFDINLSSQNFKKIDISIFTRIIDYTRRLFWQKRSASVQRSNKLLNTPGESYPRCGRNTFS